MTIGCLVAVVCAAETLRPQAGSTAPDATVSSIDGTPVQLPSLTGRGPLVLFVLRGFPGGFVADGGREYTAGYGDASLHP
jgi:hypothetical protein